MTRINELVDGRFSQLKQNTAECVVLQSKLRPLKLPTILDHQTAKMSEEQIVNYWVVLIRTEG